MQSHYYIKRLYLGSLRFFIANSSSLIREIYSKTLLLASYPNVSYTGFLKLVTLSVLPVCLISFYPIKYVREKNIVFFVIAVLGCAIFYCIARLLFFSVLRKYESSGNYIGSKIFGLLISKNKKGMIAEYSLKDIEKPIGVSEYKFFEKLPKEYADVLPSAEDIESRIDTIKE